MNILFFSDLYQIRVFIQVFVSFCSPVTVRIARWLILIFIGISGQTYQEQANSQRPPNDSEKKQIFRF